MTRIGRTDYEKTQNKKINSIREKCAVKLFNIFIIWVKPKRKFSITGSSQVVFKCLRDSFNLVLILNVFKFRYRTRLQIYKHYLLAKNKIFLYNHNEAKKSTVQDA